MIFILISILVIEIIFFILGYIYLYKVKNLRKYIKYLLNIFFYSVIVIFNITIIKTINHNYFNNNFEQEIKLINKEQKNNQNNIKKLKEIEETLNKNINTDKYLKLKTETDELLKNITDITKEIETKEKEQKALNETLEDLKYDYEELESKTKYLIKDFPTYHQFPDYPNGCESVSLYLLLKYHKVDVTVEQIVEKLKKGDAPYRKNGTLYGGDPEVEFVGDPRLKTGYGVYEKPIIDVAENFKNGIKNITGSNLDSVLKIVSNGIPVQVWVSINLRNTYVCAKWKSTSTNRYVEWKCGLHSLLIIGYTYDKVITSDPYTGNIEYYSKTQFEKMYNTYGKRAIYYES